ncbi:16S rRNA (cytidine(1402)-2'-O)-methyltransferase [Parachitinimonas caeni]|uniref:Ribosomal RNA small subunit methyltransferase I n=1 Tax=Parachitinimonas caeni TaxID=3031301 RepID=A0ABT7DTB2_9NEIS|nr:16S rRNA (cytidine(1402)-2'-O)-methyltransferase [Parachitinimonas caeni]MDK2123306.1 16S rRNA (cytidine(1402)-2'-O)-methyltransferase [Parachitinimonas caeni]
MATPIGNRTDLSPRALAVLAAVDVVAAEDTRVSGQLLRSFGVQTPLFSLREHNEREAADKVIERLKRGEAVAQISDAGTPAVSDPGSRLVAAVHAAGFKVVPIPGPSAVLAALAAGGMISPRFYFHGFTDSKAQARRRELEPLSKLPHTLVLFEAPHRIEECLNDLVAIMGADRIGVLARELTKTFETIRRAPLHELATWVAADTNQQRGEIVLLIEAAEMQADGEDEWDDLLTTLLSELPVKQAVKLAAEISGAPRNRLYERALDLKKALSAG